MSPLVCAFASLWPACLGWPQFDLIFQSVPSRHVINFTGVSARDAGISVSTARARASFLLSSSSTCILLLITSHVTHSCYSRTCSTTGRMGAARTARKRAETGGCVNSCPLCVCGLR